MTGGLQTILDSTTTLSSLVSSVFDLMVANPLLVVFLGASLIGTGIGLFKKFRRAAK